MRSGSATISRTVIRGFSDAYGSWKTICMSRRTGRICLRLYAVMSAPLKTIFPPVGSVSLMIVRPSVVLPQPDSPTTPSVSPRRTLEVDTVHSTHLADRVLEHARLDREPLDEALDAEDLVRVSGSGVDGRLAHCLAHDSPPDAPAGTRWAETSSAKWQAATWSPKSRSGGTSVRQTARPCDTRQRGWNAQPGGGLIMLGG